MAGTLIYEERSSTATLIEWCELLLLEGFVCVDIGNWTADGSGQITLFLGEGAVNTFLNGARTQLDGVAVTLVPEPSTLALLGLGGLALLIRRRK